jgi:hypothetical protein
MHTVEFDSFCEDSCYATALWDRNASLFLEAIIEKRTGLRVPPNQSPPGPNNLP